MPRKNLKTSDYQDMDALRKVPIDQVDADIVTYFVRDTATRSLYIVFHKFPKVLSQYIG